MFVIPTFHQAGIWLLSAADPAVGGEFLIG